MSDVTLSKAVRSNLLHLQNTAKMMDITQERLATGKKVNSALDNPTNFFTAASLNARAADIGTLLDSMSNGIRTIEAADNGLTAITKTIESMQSTLRQARQDKTFQVKSYELALPAPLNGAETLTFRGGALDDAISLDLTKPTDAASSAQLDMEAFSSEGVDVSTTALEFTIHVNGDGLPVQINAAAVTAYNSLNGTSLDPENLSARDVTNLINRQLGSDLARVNAAGNITFVSPTTGSGSTLQITGATGGANAGIADRPQATGLDASGIDAKSVDDLVADINRKFLPGTDTPNPLHGKVRASNDNGKLRIENLSTTPLEIDGIATDGRITGISTDEGLRAELGGNDIRANLAKQFNELRSELDRLAEDSSYNGINLLRGDALKIVFNELGTSQIEVQTRDAKGNTRPINSNELGLFEINPDQLDDDASIDELLAGLQLALGEVRSQASDLGSTLSTVQNREKFTKEMINTLETGAANLTLADTNEEGANMLALQTRQQLSQTALSLASQADQAVLRLFG